MIEHQWFWDPAKCAHQKYMPLISWTSIRLLLKLAAVYRWQTTKLDYVFASQQAPVDPRADNYSDAYECLRPKRPTGHDAWKEGADAQTRHPRNAEFTNSEGARGSRCVKASPSASIVYGQAGQKGMVEPKGLDYPGTGIKTRWTPTHRNVHRTPMHRNVYGQAGRQGMTQRNVNGQTGQKGME